MKLRAVPNLALLVAVVSLLPLGMLGGQTKDERAIRSLTEEWQNAIAAKNVDRIVALHTADAVMMPSNLPAAKGGGAIRSIYSELVNTPGLKMHWVPTRIDIASPRVATEYGTYTQSYDSPRGRIAESGNYVTIWHKVNGEWRVAVDAPISTLPMPAPIAAEAAQMVARSN